MSSKPIVLGIGPIVGDPSWKKLGEWAELKVREKQCITTNKLRLNIPVIPGL
jgi:hypothetical protein